MTPRAGSSRLKSPRFKQNPTLREVAAGSSTLGKGNAGHGIHLVQMALLDMGYPLPRSTRPGYSPDGIYGPETASVIERFQRDHDDLAVDGLLGPNTMSKLDDLCGDFERRVKLHFRLIAETYPAVGTVRRSIQSVFQQYGIDIQVVKAQSVQLDPKEAYILQVIDDECDIHNNDALQLLERDVGLDGTGGPIPREQVLVYFVNAIQGSSIGLGGMARGRPVAIVDYHPGRYVAAHEVGHALLTQAFRPRHVVNRRNLMYSDGPDCEHIPAFTNRQVARIRKHPGCRPL